MTVPPDPPHRLRSSLSSVLSSAADSTFTTGGGSTGLSATVNSHHSAPGGAASSRDDYDDDEANQRPMSSRSTGSDFNGRNSVLSASQRGGGDLEASGEVGLQAGGLAGLGEGDDLRRAPQGEQQQSIHLGRDESWTALQTPPTSSHALMNSGHVWSSENSVSTASSYNYDPNDKDLVQRALQQHQVRISDGAAVSWTHKNNNNNNNNNLQRQASSVGGTGGVGSMGAPPPSLILPNVKQQSKASRFLMVSAVILILFAIGIALGAAFAAGDQARQQSPSSAIGENAPTPFPSALRREPDGKEEEAEASISASGATQDVGQEKEKAMEMQSSVSTMTDNEYWNNLARFISIPDTLEDASSPQSQALKWVQHTSHNEDDSEGDGPYVQRYVLTVLYYALDGPQWTYTVMPSKTSTRENEGALVPWLSVEDECQWSGIFCDPDNHMVIAIDEDMGRINRYRGELPGEELAYLGQLEELVFSDEDLMGSLPTQLGLLTSLKRIRLDRNNIQGRIPTELGLLKNLESLKLDRNEIKGKIPTELGQLDKLQLLDISINQLTGFLIPELANIDDLTKLWVAGNDLTGTIPTELGGLVSLKSFTLQHNEFAGSMPEEVCELPLLETVQADCSGGRKEARIHPCKCCTSCY